MAHLRTLAVRLLLLGLGCLLLSYVVAVITYAVAGAESPAMDAMLLISTMGYGGGHDIGAWAFLPILLFGVSILALQAGGGLWIVTVLIEATRRSEGAS